MSEIPSIEEIELMDKIFHYGFNNRDYDISSSFYSEDFNIDSKTYDFIFQEICKTAESENLVKLFLLGNGNYRILDFNDYQCDKFIKNGGFKNHFKTEEITTQPIINKPKKTYNWGKISVYVAVVLAIIFYFLDMFKPELKHNILSLLPETTLSRTEQKPELVNEDSLFVLNDSLNTLSLDTIKIDTDKK